jgi:hypothetical protein
MKKIICIFIFLSFVQTGCRIYGIDTERAFELSKKCDEKGMKTRYYLNPNFKYIRQVICVDKNTEIIEE